MKIKRTIFVPETIEVEAQYVVMIRVGDLRNMSAYDPPGEWHWFALCGDSAKRAESEKRRTRRDNYWVNVKIDLLTKEETSKLP